MSSWAVSPSAGRYGLGAVALDCAGSDPAHFVLNEPRGGVFRHVNLLVPPKHPDADAAFIIMEPEDTPPMSGSNSICVSTVLLDSGILPMTEPETHITLEAPGGLVRVRAECLAAAGRADLRAEPSQFRGNARRPD